MRSTPKPSSPSKEPAPATTPKTKFFICYRREDTGPYAGRIADNLRVALADDRVFMDTDDIRVGTLWSPMVTEALEKADGVLVIIGKSWLTLERDGKRRLDDPDDWVRHEIRRALTMQKRILPVLPDLDYLPDKAQLPEDIRPLLAQQHLELRITNFRYDFGQLLEWVHATPEPASSPDREAEPEPAAPEPLASPPAAAAHRGLRVLSLAAVALLFVGLFALANLPRSVPSPVVVGSVSALLPPPTAPGAGPSDSEPSPTLPSPVLLAPDLVQIDPKSLRCDLVNFADGKSINVTIHFRLRARATELSLNARRVVRAEVGNKPREFSTDSDPLNVGREPTEIYYDLKLPLSQGSLFTNPSSQISVLLEADPLSTTAGSAWIRLGHLKCSFPGDDSHEADGATTKGADASVPNPQAPPVSPEPPLAAPLPNCTVACKEEGLCVPTSDGCIAGSAPDCERSRACENSGYCTLITTAHRCGRLSNTDCSNLCKREGLCILGDGGCRPRDDADCAQSTACDLSHRCKKRGARCEI